MLSQPGLSQKLIGSPIHCLLLLFQLTDGTWFSQYSRPITTCHMMHLPQIVITLVQLTATGVPGLQMEP